MSGPYSSSILLQSAVLWAMQPPVAALAHTKRILVGRDITSTCHGRRRVGSPSDRRSAAFRPRSRRRQVHASKMERGHAQRVYHRISQRR